MWYLVLQFRSMFLPRNGTCLLVVFPVTSAIETIFCKWISHMDDDEHDERSLGHMSSRTAGNNVFEFAEYTTVLPRHRPAAYPHKTLFIFLIFFFIRISIRIVSCNLFLLFEFGIDENMLKSNSRQSMSLPSDEISILNRSVHFQCSIYASAILFDWLLHSASRHMKFAMLNRRIWMNGLVFTWKTFQFAASPLATVRCEDTKTGKSLASTEKKFPEKHKRKLFSERKRKIEF